MIKWALISRDLTTILKESERDLSPPHRDNLHQDKPYWVPVVYHSKPVINRFQRLEEIRNIQLEQVIVGYRVIEDDLTTARQKGERSLRIARVNFEEAVVLDLPHAALGLNPSDHSVAIDKLTESYSRFTTELSNIENATVVPQIESAVSRYKDWADANNT